VIEILWTLQAADDLQAIYDYIGIHRIRHLPSKFPFADFLAPRIMQAS